MFLSDFKDQVSAQIIQNEPLKKHTTIGIGGPAKYFFQPNSEKQLSKALKLAQKHQLKIFILGSGSNILVSDQGFDGLVIKPNFKRLDILKAISASKPVKVRARHQSLDHSFYHTDLPNSFSPKDPHVQVKVGSSWKIIPLILALHAEGITGLEWFSGIPGSIGGAVYMNIHGGKYFFSDFINSVEVMSPAGKVTTLSLDQLNFDYDDSYFHQHFQVILSATLNLYHGNIKKAENIIKNWGLAKNLNQPQRSAGCVWQNLDQKTQQQLNLPTPSIGYIVDQVLNLKGTRQGDAIISEKHAAFVQNIDQATFKDALYLINLVEDKFKQRFNVKLKREIEIIK